MSTQSLHVKCEQKRNAVEFWWSAGLVFLLDGPVGLDGLFLQKAQLLQYGNHADFATELLMAKDSASVRRFLTELADKLQPLWQKEKERLLQYKQEEVCVIRLLMLFHRRLQM